MSCWNPLPAKVSIWQVHLGDNTVLYAYERTSLGLLSLTSSEMQSALLEWSCPHCLSLDAYHRLLSEMGHLSRGWNSIAVHEAIVRFLLGSQVDYCVPSAFR